MNNSNPILPEKIEDVLINAAPWERESLLRVIEKLCGEEERQRVEFWAIAEKKERP